MNFQPYYHDKNSIKILVLIIVILGIGGYSLYQAQNLIEGPQITFQFPNNGETVTSPEIEIKGIAKNITYISLNNRQIYIDNQGVFNENLLLASGYNMWKIEAKDKFGRTVSKKIELIFMKS